MRLDKVNMSSEYQTSNPPPRTHTTVFANAEPGGQLLPRGRNVRTEGAPTLVANCTCASSMDWNGADAFCRSPCCECARKCVRVNV